MWTPSDGEVEDGGGTPSKGAPSFSMAPSPASPAVSGFEAGSEANDEDTETPDVPKRNRRAEEAILLQKTGWLVLRTTAHNFNNVLRNAGVSGIRVRELYNTELDHKWGQVRALILLYKWIPDRGDEIKWNPEQVPDSYAVPGRIGRNVRMEDHSSSVRVTEDIMFCGQALDNASATQGLMTAVINIPEDDNREGQLPFKLGDGLSKVKAFMKPLDPVLRAAAISSSQVIRDAHTQAAREQPGGHPDLLDEDGKLQSISLADELWMHTIFLPGDQEKWIYELHGLSDKAKRAGYCDPFTSWTSTVFDNIDDRVRVFQDHNTPFSLFAVTSETKEDVLPRVPRKVKRRENDHVSSDGSATESSDDGKDESSVGNINSSGEHSDKVDSDEVDEETLKEEVERIRATHNYDTFFIEMMKLMASKGELNLMISNYPEHRDDETSDDDDI